MNKNIKAVACCLKIKGFCGVLQSRAVFRRALIEERIFEEQTVPSLEFSISTALSAFPMWKKWLRTIVYSSNVI